MNGMNPLMNGQHTTNGATWDSKIAGSEGKTTKPHDPARQDSDVPVISPRPYANGIPSSHAQDTGDQTVINGLGHAPMEMLQLIGKDAYLPIATLIRRSAQTCWNELSSLVDRLAAIHVPVQDGGDSRPTNSFPSSTNLNGNQSSANLEKKDRLLNFANDQKASFIKLLVLLQWSKDVEDVAKAIELNYWLMIRRMAYWDATNAVAQLKKDAVGFQIPNPDLSTAREVLSLAKVRSMPDVGYKVQKNVSSKQILRTLKSLNKLLAVRLTLGDELPIPLQTYSIHDGRVTFTVSEEFELDLSLLDENPESHFRVVDFRFVFSPSPHISDALHNEIEIIANSNLDREGLMGCYDFFHDLSLSYKVAELHKQAIELSRTQWAGSLKVELLRRTLIVHYWSNRPSAKSWIEIGVHSGKSTDNLASISKNPSLHLRWLLDGQPVENTMFELEESNLYFEGILRQVIAEHTMRLLDIMYDNLIVTPLYEHGDLEIEQTSSITESNDCCLTIQLSKTRTLRIQIEAVIGAVVISPVSEKSERLQYELNRSKNATGDFASKLLNFRCSIVEADILSNIEGSSWQPLRALRPSRNELRSLFGASVIKANFFRQSYWSREYSLAITNSTDGDCWWLLQESKADGSDLLTNARLIQSQSVPLGQEFSQIYFADLAEYASGMFVLQRLAQHLSELRKDYDFKGLSKPGDRSSFPTLSFKLESGTGKGMDPGNSVVQHDGDPVAKNLRAETNIQLNFDGIDQQRKTASIVVTVEAVTSRQTLKYLAESNFDPDLTIELDTRQITLRLSSAVGQSLMPIIIQRVAHLMDIVSCVDRIRTLPGLIIKSISEGAMTVTYRNEPSPGLSLVLSFPTASKPPHIEFLPQNTNPQCYLTIQLNRLLRDQRRSFASNLNKLLASLALTFPITSFFYNLQAQVDTHTSDLSTAAPSADPGRLRVHVIVRQPSMFALQYFSSIARLPRDSVGQETHQHLLARFEIIPHIYKNKAVWLIRPAIEEFESYTRPSYSSQSLRKRLTEEIFSRGSGHRNWLLLDSAAVTLADKPEEVLQKVHDVMSKWIQEASEKEPDDPNQAAGEKKTPSKPQMVNGTTPSQKTPKQSKTNNQQKAQAKVGKQTSHPMKNKEIIALD